MAKKESARRRAPRKAAARKKTAKKKKTANRAGSGREAGSPRKRAKAKPTAAPRDPDTTRDAHDLEWLLRLQERAERTAGAGEARDEAGGGWGDPEVDPTIVRKAAEGGPLTEEQLSAVVREAVSACRSVLRKIRVLYLGPPYSFSHVAAIERFGTSTELVPVRTIRGVFEALSRRQAQYGLVPIENSTDGRVVDTLDMFARLPLRICGEVPLRVHHYLLGRCRQDEVREVYSKPQALSQCRDWLAQHLPSAKTVEMTSTAAAAQLAADKPGAAAVAGPQAAAHYGLDVIAARIEDNPDNVTRFAVIGEASSSPTGNDKTSLMFQVPHEPGALADAMVVFKKHALNLTWIESFPLTGTANEYLFFVELEGHEQEPAVTKAMEQLQRRTVRLDVLGSYPRGVRGGESRAS